MKEEEILKFWEENKIFEKTLDKEAPKGDFVFYDGPPFATGAPHYGHILASIIKDAIPRYQTMKGKRVPRKWGWDCHGLPVENLIETELNLKSKKDIEKFGIEKFNKKAEESVLRYADEWKKIIPRIGRWVDMERDYRTMDWKYTESVWWVFKALYDKGLVYEGHKSMHICPRCETTLSNFEVTLGGYKEIKDISVTVKFELEDEPGTYVLAWTTTPWTLPGNVALAVNPDIEYVKIRITNNESRIKDEYYILAKGRLNEVFKDEKYEILEEFKGKDLIGKKYKPLFPYYDNKDLENKDNAFKIYGADFVTTEDGTGVVHIAPAFGEDDMELGKKNNLPFIQHVGMDGKFEKEVKDFSEMSVKPKDDHQSTDIEIIKFLAKQNKLFAKEKITHSYPFCWRCDTPLLNYAASSWFVKVEDIKGDMIANNQKINWVPAHLKEGRFGKGLESAPDWSVSRSRYWGAPLPVWRCEKCEEIKALGSVEDIKKIGKKSGNKYFVMRHGEAESNAADLVSSNLENAEKHPLTEKGKGQIGELTEKLKGYKIDLIFASDFRRTRETAMMAAEKIGFKESVIFDERLREINTGIFDGKNPEEYHNFFSSLEEKFYKNPPEGENLNNLKKRMGDFLYDIEAKYKGKNILIVSHEYPIWALFAAADGANEKEAVVLKGSEDDFINTGGLMELDFSPLPHNENFVLDLHRPYIDAIEFPCSCGGAMKRVPEVFDCWFESGSMPYGQAHYPFERKEEFEKNFPAEFIAEGVDQTRGWFYTLLVLSTALFGEPAYKNVIANGIILAEDGQKMSKRLKNYPDPMEVVEKYGADALRYYLLSSPAVRAESLSFSEKGVDEVNKKVVSKIGNVLSFYKMYVNELSVASSQSSDNILDKWILASLNGLIKDVSRDMDNYELDKATRRIGEFVDSLSNWYIRRSRNRFKEEGEDKKNAIETTKYILLEFSKVIAPFMPFMAEKIHQSLKTQDPGLKTQESVHLEEWPDFHKLTNEENKSLSNTAVTRHIISSALEIRAKKNIKVRQPLKKLKLNKFFEDKIDTEYFYFIKDEVNIKDVVFVDSVNGEIELDTEITEELKQEGMARELTRKIQDLRKKSGLVPQDKVGLIVETDEKGKEFINRSEEEIKKSTNLTSIIFSSVSRVEESEPCTELCSGAGVKIEDLIFKIEIKK